MHILRVETRSLDETAAAVDLGQTPADAVFLSFSDSDLNALSRAYDSAPEPKPTLRLASLAALRHPYSIDLYLESVCAQAKLVVARVLGGADYWRYGVDELAALARRKGIKLALLPGDRRADARLDQASTLPPDAVAELWRYFDEGGPRNMSACLDRFAAELGAAKPAPKPQAVRPFGRFDAACFEAPSGSPTALIVFYRSIYLASDLAPIDALARALAGRGFSTVAVYVTSLKDEAAVVLLRALIGTQAFDVVLNATAFSARLDNGEGTVLDSIDAPVLQVVLAGLSEEAWRASPRGLGSSDLAMHVALPEIDGRVLARAVSFKAAGERDAATEFGTVAHRPLADRVAFVAELASAWARLRRTPPAEKRLACVLPDYPARDGRTGYAVGLDTPASVAAIAAILRSAGYDVNADWDRGLADRSAGRRPARADAEPRRIRIRARRLARRVPKRRPRRMGRPSRRPLSDRRRLPLPIPAPRQADRRGSAGPRRPAPAQGRLSRSEARAAPFLRRLPFLADPQGADRRARPARRARHARMAAGQGGRAVERLRARSPARPDAGDLPVHRQQSGRGGAGQAADRRGDGRPSDAAADRRRRAWGGARARGPVRRIFRGAGPRPAPRPSDRGADPGEGPRDRAPRRMRRRRQAVGGGAAHARRLALRPQGHADRRRPARIRPLAGGRRRLCVGSHARRGRSRDAEGSRRRLRRGRIARPPARARRADSSRRGRPARRPEAASTSCRRGATSYAVDPRSVPTRNAWEIGRRAAEEVLARYAQDHGEWPKRIVLDLWGSATMRTGGDDLAQAFALIGCRPIWHMASNWVGGFEILPLAALGRPRVDVTLRISGLFRDIFPSQIALFSAAVRAVAECAENVEDNPLAAFRGTAPARVFGAPPGAYGVGLGRRIAEGGWSERAELAEAYLAATSHAYDDEGEGARGGGGVPRARRRRGGVRARAGPAGTGRARRRRLLRARGRVRRRRRAPRRPPGALSSRFDRARTRRNSARSSRKSRARCAVAPPIRAGLPARCAMAIAARRRSPSRWTISTPSPR